MDRRRELSRLLCLAGLLLATLVSFFYLLYDLQVNRQEEFRAKMVRSVGRTETVAAARGELTDRYGRPLITNRVIYQVTLNTSLMGDRRDAILLELMEVARDQGITWPDNLPLNRQAPYAPNFAAMSEGARNNYKALAQKLDWTATNAPGILSQLRETYQLSDDLSDAQVRDIGGILYELSLRSQEITWEEYVFAKDVDIDFISTIRERGLTGVETAPVTARKYATTYAAHILGHTGPITPDTWPTYKTQGYAMNEKVGIDGVEKAFESLLRGKAGTQVVERSAKGKITAQSWLEEPQPGQNVALTIDLPLQQKVEDVLAQRIPEITKGKGGGAAAMVDVHTGGVLAMGSYPTYDLTTLYQDAELYNQVTHDPMTPLNNRATQGMYPPGSTFKMLVAAGALEEGIITPSTLVRDTGRYTYYKSPQPVCWIYRQGGSHGNINVTKAIEVSCNVFFYDTGRRLGIEGINKYAKRFGLGQPTGIEIAEETGWVAGPDYTEKVLGQVWYEGSTLSAAIGQENNQFTPIQLANYTATLANGGTRYAVHLLQSVSSPGSAQATQAYEPQVVEQIDLDPNNLNAIKKGMLALTTTGSLGRYFQGLPVQVGAKTGSAEVAGANSNAVFVCFAPYDNPQVALALVAEQGGTGSMLASVAAEILDYYFSAQSGFTTTVEENTLLR